MTETNQPTVLIVDDEAQLLRLYRQFLTDEYVVRTASSGTDALDQLDESVEAALIDRRMPGMSGDELLEEMRARGYDGLVTMVTAVEPDTDIIDMAFDDYLVKPVGAEQLQSHVASLLRRTNYDRAVREHFSVASKVAVLEADHAPDSPRSDDEYRALLDQLDASRAEAERALSDISEAEAEALFRDLDTS